jgi:myotubularin-related protein 3/4
MYPKADMVYDDATAQQIPFPLLCGESGRYLGRCADGLVTLTTFRLHICLRKSFFNIPLGLIESVESRDMFYLVILCKDATTVR